MCLIWAKRAAVIRTVFQDVRRPRNNGVKQNVSLLRTCEDVTMFYNWTAAYHDIKDLPGEYANPTHTPIFDFVQHEKSTERLTSVLFPLNPHSASVFLAISSFASFPLNTSRNARYHSVILNSSIIHCIVLTRAAAHHYTKMPQRFQQSHFEQTGNVGFGKRPKDQVILH